MPLEVKLWKIEADKLQPIDQARLDLEERLEEWLRGDIGLLSDDLLVIGSQIARYGVPLDLLAVDRDGNLVVVELKRDRTPRDVVAQALDYASWVQELGREDVEEYAREYLKGNVRLLQDPGRRVRSPLDAPRRGGCRGTGQGPAWGEAPAGAKRRRTARDRRGVRCC